MERSHEIPPRTGSIVVDSVHAWHDENWMDQRAKTDPTTVRSASTRSMPLAGARM